MSDDQRLLQCILRNDFSSFIHKVFYTINPGMDFASNWHIDLIAEYLEAVRRGDVRRLIINMPPRALKSVCVSVAWPAWLLGHNPTTRIMAASYSHTLSIKHSMDTRFVVGSNWYHNLFPEMSVSKNHNQKSKFMTTSHGFRFSTSVGGSATGEGGDFLIIDDPHNPAHVHSRKMRERVITWYEQTFSSRLNDRNKGAIVLVMQRLHDNDLAGHLIREHAKDWEVLKIPALFHEDNVFQVGKFKHKVLSGETLHANRYSLNTIESLAREVGQNTFAAQYQQNPVPITLSVVDVSKIKSYSELPIKNTSSLTVQSWDTAIKVSEECDFSVCTTWMVHDSHYYLLDCGIYKMEYPALKKQVLTLATQYNTNIVIIEDKASGQSLIQDLKNHTNFKIIPFRPTNDKITRLASSADLFDAGLVLFPEYAIWKSRVIDDLANFPNIKHDDIIDSISQFLGFIKRNHIQKTCPRIR